MEGGRPVVRHWFIRVAPGQAHIRCSYERVKHRILRFTVQLEILHSESWIPVVRYDNAHGFCHRDTLNPDGTQDKTGVFAGDLNETFHACSGRTLQTSSLSRLVIIDS